MHILSHFLPLLVLVGCVFLGFLGPQHSYAATTFTHWNQSDFDNCVVLLSDVGGTTYDHRLYWSLLDNTTIKIGVAAKAPGWIGVGLSTDGFMDSSGAGSDAWVGWVGGSVPACAGGCVIDYWITEHAQPNPDSHGDLNTTNSEFGTIDGYTYFSFQRLLNTTDAQDRAITPDQSQQVIHALGPGLPTGISHFGSTASDTGQHIIGTNQATYMSFGMPQWTCDQPPSNSTNNNSSVKHYQNPAGTWRLNWTIIGDEIEFNVSALTTGGWWAVGVNTQDLMIGGDIMVCSWNGSGAVVVDRRAYEHDTPPADAIQNVDILSFNQENGWSTCQLRRQLDTGDTQGDLVIHDDMMKLMWAYFPTSSKRSLAERDCPDFCQHASNTKGLATVNFLTGFISDDTLTDDKRKAHGILMLFVWGLLAVAGAFIARYCKTPQGKWVLYGYVWVHLHGLVGVVMFGVNVVAFALIVSWISDQQTEHFKGAHEIIGLIMFICTFFQPLIGIIGELFLKKYRDPNWVAYVIGTTHAWFGKALVLLGLVEVYLGLALYCVPTYAMVTYGASIACMIALFVPHEILRWAAPWGAWLGGPGFTYQRVDEKDDGTEMKDFEPENKIPWMNKRAPLQPPLAVKICLWILQAGLAVGIIGLWIATAVGIGDKDITDPNDSYDSTCVIGTKFQ